MQVLREIVFPFPNLAKIFVDGFAIHLEKESMKVEDHYSFTLYFDDIEVHSISELVDYVVRLVNSSFQKLIHEWNEDYIAERFSSFAEFHSNIVNYNIRKFLSFIG